MTPAESWALVLSVCLGLPAFVVWCCCVVASRVSEAEREVEAELHSHTCTICGRWQQWREPFDQMSPCVACQARDLNRRLEIDLDDFADADAIRVYLDGHQRLPAHHALGVTTHTL